MRNQEKLPVLERLKQSKAAKTAIAISLAATALVASEVPSAEAITPHQACPGWHLLDIITVHTRLGFDGYKAGTVREKFINTGHTGRHTFSDPVHIGDFRTHPHTYYMTTNLRHCDAAEAVFVNDTTSFYGVHIPFEKITNQTILPVKY